MVRDTVPISLVVTRYATDQRYENHMAPGGFGIRKVCYLKREGAGRLGKRFSCLCPFHIEKTASFYVMDAAGRFKCFGCGRSGNAFDFVMEIENVNLPQAIQIVAEFGKVYPKPARKPRLTKRKRKRARSS